MASIESLIDVLVRCVPGLDPAPLWASPPVSTAQLDVLNWITGNLQPQGLLAYEEWKEYFGHVPDLRPLSAIDMTAFDSGYVIGIAGDIDEERLTPELAYSLPYELPYLEYMNAYLRGHGLRVVDLLPFENAFMLAVKDDESLLEQLALSLRPFGMDVHTRAALDEEGVQAYVEQLLSGRA
ncbi:hypothetical protein ACILG0_17125 [Pseudomonadota bacterium AL_CKDN230030165-1A_HGKHYDSX7]